MQANPERRVGILNFYPFAVTEKEIGLLLKGLEELERSGVSFSPEESTLCDRLERALEKLGERF